MRFRMMPVVATVALFTALTTLARAGTLQAIEYYNASLDHYFVTALPAEIADLDAGTHPGWARTGQHFTVYDPGTPVAGTSPVCRFYAPDARLDSHFYSASPVECADVIARFSGIWLEETPNAFGIGLPDAMTGACPAGTIPVYRTWNNRADSNHRFTTDPATAQAMVDRGYVAEGYGPGPLPVAMCAPTAGGAGAVPVCVLSASNTAPYVGSSVQLTASCSNAPLSFAWANCTSTTSTCTATSVGVGRVTYSVIATNAAGTSARVSVDVAWQSLPSPPKCALTATQQTNPPTAGGVVVLEAHCDAVVGSYAWSGCTSTSAVCIARETTAGLHTYSVLARNAGGTSSPAALSLNWAASPPAPPGSCGQFASYLWSDLGTQSVRIESALMPTPPAFAWNGVWTVRFVVPPTIGLSRLGRVSSAEFAGPSIVREATISSRPCDFRPTDPSGQNGPIARAVGSTNTIVFTPDPTRPGYPVLAAGGTYYYNLRNYQPTNNTITCPASAGRCDALVESLLPTN
ncbi:MAG: hypothetical protein ACM3JC_12700 [Rudaea sp.]